MMDVMIIGAGMGGLTLALTLHRAGISCRVFESTPEIKAIGAGINVLPHASKILCELGLEEALSKVGVATAESAFYNRFGQLIYKEPLGRSAGYEWPQFSIHRGDLQAVLLDAVKARIGEENVLTGWQCQGVEQDEDSATAFFKDTLSGEDLPPQQAPVLIACDGIHSRIRKQFHPNEGAPRYSGVNMWRGLTRWKPILGGATLVRTGWLETGKIIFYPVRNNIDAEGRQLVNWVAERTTPKHLDRRDWNRPGNLDDFLHAYLDWKFDWLDFPEFVRKADSILEFPMVDQDPIDRWTFGRVTLLGDAAHPMVPRGSNGAGQAILDCQCLTDLLVKHKDSREALKEYESLRLPFTTNVVLTNRVAPPDAIIGEVAKRTGDQPFKRIEDVISQEELRAMSDGYKKITGYNKEALK
jgi:5-methylphenazine-1-carboxylate 1-monooxygenase